MDKKRIVVLILSALLVVAIGCRFYVDYKNKDDNTNKENENLVVTEDSKKFKEDYEKYNNTKNSSDRDYLVLDIPEANKVTYKTDEEIVDVLNNETGLIYFGFSSCPWCRSMVETLIEVSNENNIDVYYVDVYDIRSSYVVENKKLVKTNEGTEAYYQILAILNDYLTDYILEDNNKEYDTSEKRLYAPTVIAIKNGEVVGIHEDTVSSQEDPYAGLNDDEKKELKDIYQAMVDKIKNGTCGKKGC